MDAETLPLDATQKAAPQSAPLVVFDLDGTLTTRDSFGPFLLRWALRHRRFGPLLLLPFWVLAHVCRLISTRTLKERLLVGFLGNENAAKIREHAVRFCTTWVDNHLRPEVVARLREHQRAGHRIVLLSASPSVYVPCVAEHLGISEVLCTQVQVENGVCTGKIIGPNCKGDAKLAVLTQYLQTTEAPAESYAYGDRASDLPVLTWVRHGFLVRRGRFEAVSPRVGASS